MGAAGLVEIKRRIKSVESTKKITKAMGLVATSKLRKCRRELNSSNDYFNIAEDTIRSLASMVEDNMDSIPYFNSNDSNLKLYIVITSDTGLCAGYNNNVIAYLNNLVDDEKDNARVIVVGSKGISYVKRAGFNTVAEYVDIQHIPTVKDAKVIYEKALELFNRSEVSEVYVVYTDFITPAKQEVKCEKILPIEKVEGEYKEHFVEPSIEIVLKDALDIYLKGKIRFLMLTSRCSEESSRMAAMNSATTNADDILDKLNLKYNRIRQTMITQEISEIVGGASAQK